MKLSDVAEIIVPRADNRGREGRDDDMFTAAEREYCAARLRCLGARYIIKKCVLDYLVTEKGHERHRYCDIEVVNNELGRPLIRLFSSVRECIREMKIRDISISISHSKNWVAGIVLFCY